MAQETYRRWRGPWWDLAEQFRGQVARDDPLELVRVALEHGREFTWRDLAGLTSISGTELVDPALVADFAVAATAAERARRVLDPWAGLGITLAALEAAGRVGSGVAIEINKGVYDVAQTLWRGSRVNWQSGDASELLRDLPRSFDLIVGSPPFGLKRASLKTRRPSIELTASKTYTMLVQAALALADHGTLMVVLPESFFGHQAAPVHAALEAASVYPSAALALPLRIYGPSIPVSLVVFTHEAFPELFAAELDPTSDLSAIAANLAARRAGRLPQLGRLVPTGQFVSWRSTLRGDEIRATARTMGLNPVSFSDVCVSVRTPRRRGVAFEAQPNAVYLPKLGTSSAVTSLDALSIQAHNYLQLVVRPEVVDPDYLAAFLSSPLGRKIRDQLASGTFIPQISLTSLRTGSAYLPPQLDQQQAAVRASRVLAEFQQSIAALERRVWEQPLQAGRIQSELRQLVEGGGIERWIESLPFPLASILWRYHAEEDPERQCRYLVHFFEGAVVFLVDLLVSALRRDPEVLAELRRRTGSSKSYTRSTIGNWSDLLARLAKGTRELVSKDPSLARELFRVSDLERLDAVAHKSIVFALMQEATSYRNDWIGHAPMADPRTWQRRLVQAEATLANVRAALSDALVGWELVRAGQGSNHDGVITTSIERLTGAQRAFRRGHVELLEWPEEGRLYMLEEGANLPLRLSRLVTMRHPPEGAEDACYFYDRIQDDGVRTVSYHFEQESLVVTPDTEVAQLIDELNELG